MRVHNGHDVRPRFEYAAVDEAFQVEGALLLLHWLPIERQFHDVVMDHQFRSQRARQKKSLRSLRMTALMKRTAETGHYCILRNAIGPLTLLLRMSNRL